MLTAPEVNALVELWWPLAGGIARKWGTRFPWLTDCFQSAAGEALWKLAREHGELPTATFSGYVRKAVRWAILHRLRVERTRNPFAFDQRPAPTDPDGAELLELQADDAPEVGAAIEVADELEAALAGAELSARQRELFVRHVGGGESLTNLAVEQGVSRSRVGHLVADAIEKILYCSPDINII